MINLLTIILLTIPITFMYFVLLYYPLVKSETLLKSEIHVQTIDSKSLPPNPSVDTGPSEPTGPFEPPLIISNMEFCKKYPNLDGIFYMLSSGEDFERRSLFRQTWANAKLFKDFAFRTIYLLGKVNDDIQPKVNEESEKYGDIVQADFVDNFRNLTLKSILGLRWVSTYCPHAAYALKVDDDMFINVFSVVELLQKYRQKSNAIFCRMWNGGSMPILRDPATCGRYCAAPHEFPGQHFYPQYCSGPFYAIARKLVKELYDASRSTPYFFCEDVYVTGLLTQKISDQIDYIRIGDRFERWEDALPTYKNKSLQIMGDFIHIEDRDIQIDLWNSLLDRLTDSQKALLQQDVSTYKAS